MTTTHWRLPTSSGLKITALTIIAATGLTMAIPSQARSHRKTSNPFFDKFNRIMMIDNPGYSPECLIGAIRYDDKSTDLQIARAPILSIAEVADLIGSKLSFYSCDSVDWSAIGWEQLKDLQSLSLLRCKSLEDLSFLTKISNLSELEIRGDNYALTSLYGLRVDKLTLGLPEDVDNLNFLETLGSAKEITLSSKELIKDTSGLAELGRLNVKRLDIRDLKIKSLEFLRGDAQLTGLKLPGNKDLDLAPVSRLKHLETLRIGHDEYSDEKLDKLMAELRAQDVHPSERPKPTKSTPTSEKTAENDNKPEKLKVDERKLAKEVEKELDLPFNAVSKALVTITTSAEAAGSGFIVKDSDGKYYLYTNQHVVSGCDSFKAKTLSNRALQPGPMQVSASRDIIRFTLPKYNGPDALTPGAEVAAEAPVAVLGNSGGAGVCTTLYGKVLGVGPDRIEVSAKFVPGNSGSPVVTKGGKVVGIATYATMKVEKANWTTKGTNCQTVRRFAYRIAPDVKWVPMKWKLYKKLTKQIEADKKSFEAILALAVKWGRAPYKPIVCEYVASDVKSWLSAHNTATKKLNRMLSPGINDSKRKAWNKMAFNQATKSYKKLSGICKRRAAIIRARTKSMSKYLTPFIKKKIQGTADLFDNLAKGIEKYGKKLISREAVAFK